MNVLNSEFSYRCEYEVRFEAQQLLISYLSVDEGNADHVIMEQHAALPSERIQLLCTNSENRLGHLTEFIQTAFVKTPRLYESSCVCVFMMLVYDAGPVAAV